MRRFTTLSVFKFEGSRCARKSILAIRRNENIFLAHFEFIASSMLMLSLVLLVLCPENLLLEWQCFSEVTDERS